MLSQVEIAAASITLAERGGTRSRASLNLSNDGKINEVHGSC
jgi:hypothetical protein